MKLPKKVRKFCPFCGKYTEHTVIIVKAVKRRRAMSKGQRRFLLRTTAILGYGGFPRPKIENSSKYGVKITKKVNLLFKCSECGKMHGRSRGGFRARKVELV